MNMRAFIKEISPETIALKVRARHDHARVRYARQSNVVADYAEFRKVVVEYYTYHMMFVRGECNKEDFVAYGEVKNLLCRSFGNIENALHEAITGMDGGLNTIFDVICSHLINQDRDMYINDVIERYITPLKPGVKREFVEQYVKERFDSETAKRANIDAMCENINVFVDAIIKSMDIATKNMKML